MNLISCAPETFCNTWHYKSLNPNSLDNKGSCWILLISNMRIVQVPYPKADRKFSLQLHKLAQ